MKYAQEGNTAYNPMKVKDNISPSFLYFHIKITDLKLDCSRE